MRLNAVVVALVAVAGPARADQGLSDPKVIADGLGDSVTYAGLGFASADCEAKFAKPGTLAKGDRAAFATCVAQLALARDADKGAYVATAGGTSAPHLLVAMTSDWGKVTAFGPVATAGDDATLPTVKAWNPEPKLQLAADLQATAIRNAQVKVCLDAGGRAGKPRIVQSSGVSQIDDAVVAAVTNQTYKPIAFGGKPVAACTIATWTSPNSAPVVVPPKILESYRTGGATQIVPDDATKVAMVKAGKSRVIGTFKICLADDGKVSEVKLIKSTGFPDYDEKITSTIRTTWKYSPWLDNGKPVPVCTAVTFIYTQK